MNNGRRWTTEDDDFLLAHMADMSVEKIAEHLNRTRNAVIQRRANICKSPIVRKGTAESLREFCREKHEERKSIRVLTIEQQAWLASNYAYLSDSFCALRLDIPVSDVRTIAKAMKLKKINTIYK